MIRYYCKIITLLFACTLMAGAQIPTLRSPLDIPAYLSGNFGELRSNHFHSGLDFKTQGVEGHNVYAVQKGYIGRIVVSSSGYGRVIYIVHPALGIKTVYAHLQKFEAPIAEYVRNMQYKQESFAVDLTIPPGTFPVDIGDRIGLSGNSGSSGGPHLHFEIRDLRTEDVLDPLPYYSDLIRDTKPPRARSIMVYPIVGQGSVNRGMLPVKLTPVATASGKQSYVEGRVSAWGKIGFSINADDYMNETTNVYGVKELRMYVDGVEFFSSNLDRFSITNTRYMNNWIDYDLWIRHHVFYRRTFIGYRNALKFIHAKDRGIVTIDEVRGYRITFILSDAYGNSNQLDMEVMGMEQDIELPDHAGSTQLYWQRSNVFESVGLFLYIPTGSLSSDVYLRHSSKPSEGYLSDIHDLHDVPIFLHPSCRLSLALLHDPCRGDRRKYGIVSIRGDRVTWVGGSYRAGWVESDIRELGLSYAIGIDTVPPRIVPLLPSQWHTKREILFRITDSLSGIKSYRGEIDGAYALFEYDAKSNSLLYTFDATRLPVGAHRLRLSVTDRCGNVSIYEGNFSSR